jgi:hypothetical protein
MTFQFKPLRELEMACVTVLAGHGSVAMMFAQAL